ncbi:hypothetical protein XELAEV_18006692mg [Xenopus laevis]|uniref:Thioredoxin domain-containing protein n=1 Tax=Xenopus laevis TaxID=8355 RepID=A0A974DZ39_XENLA|nr:hypothetical protein XELAEV_18006692mg [Xenopus laevis]
MIRYLKTVEEYERALQDAGRKLVVINFSSQKCGQCGIVAPQFEKLCQHCEIHSTPTFIFYKAQKKVERFSAVDMLQVKRTIEKLL